MSNGKRDIKAATSSIIDVTNDKRIEALYNLLQNDISPQYTFTTEEMNVLHERAEKYLKGEGKTYTVEESHAKILQAS